MKHYGYDDLAILVSERGHYSLKKAADVLGLGRDNLIAIKTDENNRICLDALESTIADLKQRNIKPFAIVGLMLINRCMSLWVREWLFSKTQN